MRTLPWLLVMCACAEPLLAEGGAATYTFRSAEAVDETRLAACPDGLREGLSAGATLARDGADDVEGTLGLLGEVVPVRFHDGDENERPGVYPLDFAAVHHVGEVGWYLLEAEPVSGGLSVVIEAERGECVILARFDQG